MSLLFTQWKLNEAVMTFEGILEKSVFLSSFLYIIQMAQHRYREAKTGRLFVGIKIKDNQNV